MPIAIAVVFFLVACLCLYGMFHAMLGDAGPFAAAALLLAAVNAAAGVLNCTGAPSGLLTVAGALLCAYAFIGLIWAWLLWDDAFVLGEYRDFTIALLAGIILTVSAVLQFTIVA